MVKLTDKQEVTLTFTHVNGLPSSLYVAMNPMTGDWMQVHKISGQESCYAGQMHGNSPYGG
jgi:hypothetical protein